MTQAAQTAISSILANAWRLASSFTIPGTFFTPVAMMMFPIVAGVGIRAAIKLFSLFGGNLSDR